MLVSNNKQYSMNRSKRKRDEEEYEQPDAKKRKTIGTADSFNLLETYNESDIKKIIAKINRLENVDAVEIESGFNLIRPNYALIKLNNDRKFVKVKKQVKEVHLRLATENKYDELGINKTVELFVTGDDVELDGIDDPDDASHYLYLGNFMIIREAPNLTMWMNRPTRKLSPAAISKLGRHVIDPTKVTETSSDKITVKEDKSTIMDRVHAILASLPSVQSLPILNAPQPFVGSFHEALRGLTNGSSVHENILTFAGHQQDIAPIGQGLMLPDCRIAIIRCNWHELARAGVEEFLAGVAHSTKITKLELNGSTVLCDNSRYSKHYASLLAVSKSLKKLIIKYINLIDFDSFCVGISSSSSLDSLFLERCKISDVEFSKLVAVLCNAESPLKLKHLNLTGNNITEASGEMLQYLLEHNSTLEAICFNGIETFNEGLGIYLGRGLAKNKTLKRLHFSKTKLGARGAAAMFKEITKVNNTLEALNFEMCKIGKQGGDALVEFLKTNSSISFLHLGSAGIAEKTWPQLLKIMEDKMNIAKFTINHCDEQVGDVNVKDLILKSPRLAAMRASSLESFSPDELLQ